MFDVNAGSKCFKLNCKVFILLSVLQNTYICKAFSWLKPKICLWANKLQMMIYVAPTWRCLCLCLLNISCVASFLFYLGKNSDRSVRHFSSPLEASRTPEFQYLYRTHRFLRTLQLPVHFSSGVLSRTKWRLRIPRVRGFQPRRVGLVPRGRTKGRR